MAEVIATEIIKVVFKKLADEAIKQVVRSQGIHSELKKLGKTLSKIQKLLNDASEKEVTDEAVQEWLNGLQHLAYDIDDILDDLATEAMHQEFTEQSGATTSKVRKLIPTCCTNFSLSNRMHPKLSKIATKLQVLEKEKSTLGLSEKKVTSKRRIQTSLVDASSIIGRDGDKEVLLHKLLSDRPYNRNFSILPIVGMGGVGKTTLAQLLYDEEEVKNHFELNAWVCVSDDFDIFNISKVIFQSVTGKNKEFADLNLLQVALRDELRGKRFLLALDDVWSDSYEDWESLVGPFHACAPGSKIIMTTRKELLLKTLGYNNLNHLQSLSQNDALSLFSQNALGVNNFDSHPTLETYGKKIVKKCDGLPLALKALGRLLRTKTDEEEWKEVLNSEIWRLQDGGGILPALRLSYLDLSSSLKRLFSYCSLFPKDYLFDKEDLILLWMAEGFLQQSSSSKSMERMGNEYFEELLSRSFFQKAPNGESMYMMHDLMNDLAIFVAGDFFFRLDTRLKKDVSEEALGNFRHFSFVCEEYVAYGKFKAFERSKSLRTFLAARVDLHRFSFFSDKILVDLILELPLLRVLSLSHLMISEVPESIGNLKHLRYLNLSHSNITHLPENVCNLYNLQSLIIFGCGGLSKLPNNFLKLKNLRHFDIRNTRLLKEIPLGISELTGLQILSNLGSGGVFINEVKDLKYPCEEVFIKGLDKVQNVMQARDVNLSQKVFTELCLEWSDVYDDGSRKEILEQEVLNVLMPNNEYLKALGIMSYGGIEFPKWVGSSSFLQLTKVLIRGCKKCTSLPSLGQLPSLKELLIESMDEVKVVGSEFFGTSLAFPSLEILYFEDMQGWEVWSTNSGVVFPRLQNLFIRNCPNLVEVSIEALPSLRCLDINECNPVVLRSIVYVALSVTKLSIGSISGLTYQVWRGVMEYLRVVEVVEIEECNDIEYLWESEAEASKVLVNLRKLKVEACEDLVRLGEKEEEDDDRISILTSLRTMELTACISMESCCCPQNIEKLSIYSCCSLTSISFPAGGGKMLKSLVISGCDNLLEEELGGGTKSRVLEYLEISYMKNFKSMVSLSYCIHLTELKIVNCSDMESFPDHELPNLTSLKVMEIDECPSIDASFPRGKWPPNLSSLAIGRLKTPISKWGPQNFPASLVKLILWGGRDDLSNFSQLSDLFPSSLTSLRIFGFKKLESLSKGLEHLTSLQHLDISYCPNVIHLPVTVLPSVLSIYITRSPLLEERCSRRGSNWPLIYHIPNINIY